MDAPRSLVDAVADRYAVDREVGRGGMATVYLARDIRHNRKVALKVLDPELGAVLGAERFLSEIQVTANLQHPNLVPLFDSGDAAGMLFYVMPFVEGESLRARIEREKQLPIDEAIRIGVAIAAALDYAHGHGVIHRDLKPENILLQAGQPVVADFGIALAVSRAGGARVTQTGLSLGTPQYMSPEQATGDRSIDGRTDIYSLGAMLYEMITGEPPHTGTTSQAIVAKLMTEEVRPLTVLRRSVPPHVDLAVRHALEKLPADRFATAGEFARALQDRNTAHVVAEPATGLRTRRRAAWLSAIGGAALGVLAGWASGSFSRAAETPAAEPRFFSIALPDSAPLVAARGYYGIAVTSLAIAPDGRAIAYTTRTADGSGIVLSRLDGGGTRTLAGTEGGRSPAFSPDGRALAFVVGDTAIRRVSLDDGSVTHLATARSPTDLLWLRDGSIYVADFCPMKIPAAGGTPSRIRGSRCSSVISSVRPVGTHTDRFLTLTDADLAVVRPADSTWNPLLLPGDTSGGARPIHGSHPFVVADRYLVFLRDSTLFAAPYDVDEARLLGGPQPVLAGVRAESFGSGQSAISDDGTLVWASGGSGALSRFVRVSADGTVLDTLPLPGSVVDSYSLSSDGTRLAYSRLRSDGSPELVVADLERRVSDVVPFPYLLSPGDWVNGGRELATHMRRPDGTLYRGMVRFSSSAPVIDTLAPQVDSDSRDGRFRCRTRSYRGGGTDAATRPWRSPLDTALVMWKMSGAPDTLRLSRSGGWCRFSPDSRFVSWIESGAMYVAATDPARGGARVQLASGGADEPRWSADSRTIFYRSATRWYSVPAPTADLKPAGVPKLLFQGFYLQAWKSWELDPQGRFLLLEGQPARHTTRLNVMTHFDEFLRRKLEGPQPQ